MNNKAVVTFVVVILLAITGFFYLGNSSSKSASASPSPSANATPAVAAAATITYGSNGFSPGSTTVKTGDSVTFANTSSSEVQVDSDPHPAHTNDTDLNVGIIAPGGNKTVVLTKTGSFGIHNHLDPSVTAKVVIQ